jgi:hypothetical protein
MLSKVNRLSASYKSTIMPSLAAHVRNDRRQWCMWVQRTRPVEWHSERDEKE